MLDTPTCDHWPFEIAELLRRGYIIDQTTLYGESFGEQLPSAVLIRVTDKTGKSAEHGIAVERSGEYWTISLDDMYDAIRKCAKRIDEHA